MSPCFTFPTETSTDNAATPNKSISYYTQIYLQRGGTGCSASAHSYRVKKFAVVVQHYIFDTEHISHGQYTASPFGIVLLEWNLENRVPSLAFMGKTSFVIVGSSFLAK